MTSLVALAWNDHPATAARELLGVIATQTVSVSPSLLCKRHRKPLHYMTCMYMYMLSFSICVTAFALSAKWHTKYELIRSRKHTCLVSLAVMSVNVLSWAVHIVYVHRWLCELAGYNAFSLCAFLRPTLILLFLTFAISVFIGVIPEQYGSHPLSREWEKTRSKTKIVVKRLE